MYAATDTTHQPADIVWLDYELHRTPPVPPAARHWLLDPGSLTQRLIAASDNHFSVELLSHNWQRPLPDERRALGMASRDRAIVRQVLLRCHGEPWVFARSVIPARSMTGRLRRLRKFSDRSLGALLFRDVSIRRQPFEVTVIPGQHPLIPPAVRQPQPIWGRRCRFTLGRKPILVAEFFLPSFKPWARDTLALPGL